VIKKMETEEILEKIEETPNKIEITPEIKKKRNFYTNEEIVLITTVAGIGIIFIILMWVFGVNTAPGWTFFP
jgi:hypothetical protein